MIEPLMVAAQRLAEALRAENEALARLDLSAAAELGRAKRLASDAFAAAYDAAQKTGSRVAEADRARAEAMALRLRDLSAENRRLLERAIELQSRVIETIAGAAKPAGPATYGARGVLRDAAGGPMAISARG